MRLVGEIENKHSIKSALRYNRRRDKGNEISVEDGEEAASLARQDDGEGNAE